MRADTMPATRAVPSDAPTTTAARGYVGRVVIAVAVVLIVATLVHLREIVVLVFGSIVVAVALRRGARPLRRWIANERRAVVVFASGTLTALGLGVWLLGQPIGDEFESLRRALPAALGALERWLDSHAPGRWLLAAWPGVQEQLDLSRLAGLAGSAAGAFGAAVLMLVVGLYLALDPTLYRRGAVQLLPPAVRPRVERALLDAGEAISRWLLGQACVMLAVGLLTAVGLMLIGMPLALPLGIVAGLLEFVPYFGTFAASALVVLLALTEGPQQAAYAALVCIAVQQFEGYVLQPLVQRRAVALPPALGLVAVLAFGLLFGPIGLVFAVPIAVAAMVMIQRLYIQGGSR
jgi:predicted PurR-regulated permease PerM